jgi:hypothetical protein
MRLRMGCLASSILSLGFLVAAAQTPPVQAQTNSSGISKVMIIMEENHGIFDSVAGMPNLMGLANSADGGWLTNYYASGHPSTPNYVALTSGVVTTGGDCLPSECPQQQQSVFAAAINSGNTAASYQESMPSNCDQTNSSTSPYVVRHNPWAYYVGTTPVDERQACQTFDVPLAGPTSPLPSPLPTVSLVTPNEDDDAHDGPLADADAWLSSFLTGPTGVLSSPDYTSGALAVIVTFDESSAACGCGNNVINVLLHHNPLSPDLTGGPITTASRLTHLDTYQSLLAVATGTGTGPLLGAFFNPTPTPGVFTDAASNVVDTSATLRGIVNPLGTSTTTYHFEYGTTKYGQSTPTVGPVGSAQNVSASLTGLAPATTYQYRLVATSSNGTSVGAGRTFTTTSSAGQAPTVATSPATDVAATTAILNGMVNPQGSDTRYHFEYGTTTSYGTLGSGSGRRCGLGECDRARLRRY